jgi:restriction endonuclease S subunit
MKESLNRAKTVYANDFIMVRVDKTIYDLMSEKPAGRFDPQYWEINFQTIMDSMKVKYPIEFLSDFIDFITYGQVGSRVYSKKGKVRYIQTINLSSTGIDYIIKEAFIDEGSYNDPDRSRLKYKDILLGNAGMGGLGKCVIFLSRLDKVNISQDIDILRIKDLNPFYVTVFLKSKLGNSQIWIRSKGVGAPKLPFDEIKAIKIPLLPNVIQAHIESEYKKMSVYHNKAMQAKAENNQAKYKKNIEIAETMLRELISKTEAVIRGEREDVV